LGSSQPPRRLSQFAGISPPSRNLVNPTERHSRRTLQLARPSDAPRPEAAQAGIGASARRASRDVTPLEKRVGQLTAQKREAQSEARAARAEAAYWHGAAVAALEAVRGHTELHARAVVAAFCDALTAIADADPATAAG